MNNEIKEDQDKIPNVKNEDWNAAQLAEESTNKPSDEIMREILRGNESKEEADERDVVGSVDSNDTPQGREESKKDETVSKSQN